jgi:hypothetical protein
MTLHATHDKLKRDKTRLKEKLDELEKECKFELGSAVHKKMKKDTLQCKHDL